MQTQYMIMVRCGAITRRVWLCGPVDGRENLSAVLAQLGQGHYSSMAEQVDALAQALAPIGFSRIAH